MAHMGRVAWSLTSLTMSVSVTLRVASSRSLGQCVVPEGSGFGPRLEMHPHHSAAGNLGSFT